MKLNKKHGGKEFKSFFRVIGKVKPVRKKDGDNWVDVSVYQTTTTQTGKPRRVLQFNVETAFSNELKVELAGMEKEKVYIYSSKHKKTVELPWKDRLDKTKYPDESYHLIGSDWDDSEAFGQVIKPDMWVEVKGKYEFSKFTTDEGEEKTFRKRIITNVEIIEDGQTIKVGKEEFPYMCDFTSPDFREVNLFNLEVGIRSTYQDEETKDTKINGVFLSNGKERSVPNDVELIVYHQEAAEGKKSLAEAFATLERLDLIEVTGVDNNRATFTYVEEVEELEEDDPFAELDDQNKVTRMKRVNTGDKKGLEVTGYVVGTKLKDGLTEEEITPAVVIEDENPFTSNDDDPFADL